MQVKLIAVGRLKEKYLRQGIGEYRKRLQAYCRLDMVEVKDESFRETELASQRDEILEKETQRVLREVSNSTYLVVLDVDGEMVSSEGLAERLRTMALTGQSHITFVIGGTLGNWCKTIVLMNK